MTRAGSLSVGRGISASADYLSKAYCLQDFQLNPQAFQLLNLGHAHTNEDTSEKSNSTFKVSCIPALIF